MDCTVLLFAVLTINKTFQRQSFLPNEDKLVGVNLVFDEIQEQVSLNFLEKLRTASFYSQFTDS